MKKGEPHFHEIVRKHWSRREFIKKTGQLSGASILAPTSAFSIPTSHSNKGELAFDEVDHSVTKDFSCAKGHSHQVLIRWGDPIFPDTQYELSRFDPLKLNATEQEKRFGYNNDYVGFLPLPFGSQQSTRGLLVVNHEYTTTELMFPDAPKSTSLTKQQVDIDIAAQGMSVVEVFFENNQWNVNRASKYNRRITPLTESLLSGPAAKHNRMKTIISQDGVRTLGTYGNCAGGVTPWGTVLSGEENVDAYFIGRPEKTKEAENYKRFGMGKQYKSWGNYYERWNLDKNPNEALHVGWIVEIDPFDPDSLPKKRTALGRFKHEGANIYVDKHNHVVAYMGDDQRFEYIYRFVSKHTYKPNDRAANMDLLDEGTLSVAKFREDGTLTWLPLVFGKGPLNLKNGFNSQADVVIDARKAADLLGATPMDRPEDVDINPTDGYVYAMLTNNVKRLPHKLDKANPRPFNLHGQVIRFWPKDDDHTKEKYSWELFLLAGNPKKSTTLYHPNTSEKGWLSCPDNCAFDTNGNIWIATDGAEKSGISDGLWASESHGTNQALTKRFLKIPIGAEMCGPFFTQDSCNLFCAVQHPASGSSFEKPSTRWPDFDKSLPPRPAVVVIRKNDGTRIGS